MDLLAIKKMGLCYFSENGTEGHHAKHNMSPRKTPRKTNVVHFLPHDKWSFKKYRKERGLLEWRNGTAEWGKGG